MPSPITPMLALSVTAYANTWYNNRNSTSAALNVKPLLFGGVATVFLEIMAAVPEFAPVATGIGWLALVGYLLAGGGGKGTPIGNLSTIGKG